MRSILVSVASVGYIQSFVLSSVINGTSYQESVSFIVIRVRPIHTDGVIWSTDMAVSFSYLSCVSALIQLVASVRIGCALVIVTSVS